MLPEPVPVPEPEVDPICEELTVSVKGHGIDEGGVAEVLLQGGAAVAGVFQDGPGSSL